MSRRDSFRVLRSSSAPSGSGRTTSLGFSFVALVTYAPIIAFWLLVNWSPSLYEALSGDQFVQFAVAFALMSLAAQFATAAVTYGVVEQLAGRRTSVGAMLAAAVRRGPGVLAVAVSTFAVTIRASCFSSFLE